MKPIPALPYPDTALVFCPSSNAHRNASAPAARFATVVAAGAVGHFLGWTITATAAPGPAPRFVGPGEQQENQQEEDADDLELESDEDPSKLRGTRPGADGSTTPARGGDGTINPPFP